jgi:predicted DNA binding CopG/RHH family protein
VRKTRPRTRESTAAYYDRRGILSELKDADVEFSLDEELRRQILRGARTRRLRNLTIKLDPVQIQALRKIATRRSIPYQTLIRQWLADGIRRELRLTGT